MDMYWRYGDLKDGVAEGPGFLGPRAVRDEVERIFHEFNSRSIQHLVHEIGVRLKAYAFFTRRPVDIMLESPGERGAWTI